MGSYDVISNRLFLRSVSRSPTTRRGYRAPSHFTAKSILNQYLRRRRRSFVSQSTDGHARFRMSCLNKHGKLCREQSLVVSCLDPVSRDTHCRACPKLTTCPSNAPPSCTIKGHLTTITLSLTPLISNNVTSTIMDWTGQHGPWNVQGLRFLPKESTTRSTDLFLRTL